VVVIVCCAELDRQSAKQLEDDDDGNRCKKKQPGEKGDVCNSFIKKRPQSGFHGSIGEKAG
jgi:hypothetical protein